MSLIQGDSQKRDQIFGYIQKFGLFVSIASYLAGLVYFCMLPHGDIVHRTYLSENALSPGLVSSDIYSTDMLYYYHDLLKNHLETQKAHKFDVEFIKDLLVNKAHIESFIQHFNVSHPFLNAETRNGANVYAYGRAYRTDGTESIVVSAPLYYMENNVQVPNLGGISELFIMADLVRTRPYWAKDLIFLITDVGYAGTQAFINSYFDLKSPYIESENLIKRGGSIQAALNLEFKDLLSDKIELKLEGSNGKLPNLDLFNTVIRICKSVQFKCSLASEKSPVFSTQPHSREPANHIAGLHNIISMVFKQSTGLSSSSHGFFLEQRIEALTMTGKMHSAQSNKKVVKQNVLKMTRVIESTLRSINNLLERFHQSFFFYLMPSSNHYVSIGNYMPAFGLICLPLLIQMIKIWCSIFMEDANDRKEAASKDFKQNFFWFAIPNVFISLAFGIVLEFGTPYFISYGKKFQFQPEESFLFSYISICLYIIASPLVKTKFGLKSINAVSTERNTKILNFLILMALVVFMGSLSLLNFSFAFLMSIFYVPIALIAIAPTQSKFLGFLKSFVLVLTTPMVLLMALLFVYSAHFEQISVFSDPNFIGSISKKLYNFAVVSRVSHVWTISLLNIFLIPIWSLLWFTSLKRT